MRLPVLFYLYCIIQVGAAAVGGFRYRYLLPPLRLLVILIVFSSLEMFAQWILATRHIRNLWLSHFYTLMEFSILSGMYLFWIPQLKYRRMLIVCYLVFLLIWITGKWTFETLAQDDGWTNSLSKIIQIGFGILVLHTVAQDHTDSWFSDSRFWVTAGIVIYASGSLFLEALFSRLLNASPELLRSVWALNWILLSIMNVLYVRGLLCRR